MKSLHFNNVNSFLFNSLLSTLHVHVAFLSPLSLPFTSTTFELLSSTRV